MASPMLRTGSDGASTPSLTASSSSDFSIADRLAAPPDDPKPLPPLPRKAPARPRPPMPAIPSQPQPDTAARRSRVLSGFAFSLRVPFISVAKEPGALARLLHHLSWADFRSLALLSKEFRRLFFSNAALRHVVLSRYVPGYRFCLGQSDLRRLRDVPVTMNDLERFMISQRVPLHRYPAHALTLLSALLPTLDLERTSERYALLALAHSRFVLLLQALLYSSSRPSPESEPDLPRASSFPSEPSLRHLDFPAPLYYTQNSARPDSAAAFDALRRPRHPRRLSHQPPGPGAAGISSLTDLTVLSSKVSAATSKASRRAASVGGRSLFGRKSRSTPLPEPLAEPHALKQYNGTWRKSWWIPPDDDLPLTPPRRHGRHRTSASHGHQPRPSIDEFSYTHGSSSGSGASSPVASPSPAHSQSSLRNVHPPQRAHSPQRPRPRPVQTASPSSSLTSGSSAAHDILTATSRLRAPVLRVYHPCSALTPTSIGACEAQLADAGLWAHLSAGDVVCNLGYIPPADDMSASSESDTSAFSAGTGRTWLVYDGRGLVPYVPPAPPPVTDPLLLPSPLYYAHIAPLMGNPVYRFTLPRLPAAPVPPAAVPLPLGASTPSSDAPDEGHFRLARMSVTVKSAASPGGHAVVEQYMWLATVRVDFGGEGDAEVGEGWRGEWVLQGPGTREGRIGLEETVCGRGGEREWEVVRSKCGRGRLWLALRDTESTRTQEL